MVSVTRVTLRLPDELAARLYGARGRLSVNAEIVRRLEESFMSGLLTTASSVGAPSPKIAAEEKSPAQEQKDSKAPFRRRYRSR